MSAVSPDKKSTPADLRARKGGVPLVCLTCYTAPMARLLAFINGKLAKA